MYRHDLFLSLKLQSVLRRWMISALLCIAYNILFYVGILPNTTQLL